MSCCKTKGYMELPIPRKPCVVQLPAVMKNFREPKRHQRPKEVPSMLRQPKAWNPKDPKEERQTT